MERKYKSYIIVKTPIKQVYNGKNRILNLYKVFDKDGKYDVYLSQYTLKETKEYIDKEINGESGSK